MKRDKKNVEYKDTFEFSLFPEYTYTKAQRRRVRLFQGRVEHWRKAINYADSFPGDDRINVLYMIGYNPKMKAYVEKTQNNVVILCAKFSSDDLAIYDRYHEFVKKLMSAGLSDQDGNIVDCYYENREIVIQNRHIDDTIETFAQRYEKEAEIITAYEDLKKRSWRYFERYTLIDKMHPERTIAHDRLDWLIKRYYPKGREQCGLGDKAYTGIKPVNEALLMGLERADCRKLLGIAGDTPLYELFKAGIKRCEMNINVAIRATSHVDLAEMFMLMQKRPYGWSRTDIHSAYCFGYAVSEYLENGYLWDGVASWPFKDSAYGQLLRIVKGTTDRFHKCILFTEDGWRLVNRLSYMFNVEKVLPLSSMILNVNSTIESKTRYPVSILDARLWELLSYFEDGLNDSDTVKELIKYFDWQRCERICDGFQQINQIVPEMVKKRYPGFPLDELDRFCTTQCSGWLWKQDMFWETVERYGNLGFRPYE